MDETDRVVGVLGGLGPEATLDFMAKLLERTTALTGAVTDQEHLHLLVDCNPKVPNRNRAVAGTGPSPAPDLAAMARRLDAAGADLLVMACNTAHHWEADIGFQQPNCTGDCLVCERLSDRQSAVCLDRNIG